MYTELERRRLFISRFQTPMPALFLDRDGVLIEDKHYLCDPSNVELCPGAIALVATAHSQNWPVVVITNQSGIARGYLNWQDYELVSDRLQELLGSSAPLAAIYANGHGPQAPPASWRKPSPAMLLTAADDLNIDLNRSILVGDRLSDLQAGASACMPCLAHVLSGHGEQERSAVITWAKQSRYSMGNNSTPELLLLQSLLEFPLQRLKPKFQLAP